MIRVQDLLINQKANGVLSPQKIEPKTTNPAIQKTKTPDESFSQVLDKQIEKTKTPEIQFSAHAVHRLKERNILLTDNDVTRLQGGLDKANEKGSSNSLLMLDNTAFIVNIKNKMVVTAVDSSMTLNHVFTNIDSATIV